jgi:hypothetical protein
MVMIRTPKNSHLPTTPQIYKSTETMVIILIYRAVCQLNTIYKISNPNFYLSKNRPCLDQLQTLRIQVPLQIRLLP